MNRNEAKEMLSERRFIENYLHSKGINTRKNFPCLSGTHKDSNPSMALIPNGNRIHCFSCNATYDLFDLIGMDYGLNDFKDQLDKAIEIFNINGVEAYQNPNRSERITAKEVFKPTEESFSKDYENWNRNIEECTYLQERGISTETANKLQLGYYKGFSTKDEVTEKFTKWNALIIPTSDNSYVARNTDKEADFTSFSKWANTNIYYEMYENEEDQQRINDNLEKAQKRAKSAKKKQSITDKKVAELKAERIVNNEQPVEENKTSELTGAEKLQAKIQAKKNQE